MNSKKNSKSVKDPRSIVQSSKDAVEFMRLAAANSRKTSLPKKSSIVAKTSAETRKEANIRKNFGISVQEYEKLSYTNVDKLFELNAKMLNLSLKK